MCAHVHICSIAVVYEKEGKLPEALELYQKSLATTEKALGGNHPLVADTKNKYAAFFNDLCRSLIK